ncbi:hypothetical protein NUU61_005838 [Penicillium alfredii]|uniref:FAD-binding domain-containing protein n=1 Tax=Penicillium alfredii TaxID=1506179 RepID=A0A9W9K913_9EURO|nr:uncharacterized protein NUU61_005838 [Penicillium alfredii]KAJ5096482.1 hypothetical protein NUU61_005838 [Penicillium alfredii]
MTPNHVAIIGAGFSGLVLALSLQKQSVSCTIYEAHSASLDIGAIMLSPNVLRILDAIGIYQQIRPRSFQFQILHFCTDPPVDTFEFGNRDRYGYDALRIYRYHLIDVLVATVKEKGISIEYGKKLTRVVSWSETEVSWEFDDGTTDRAAYLVGADGSEVLIGKQKRAAELDREGWNQLMNDKQRCVDFLRQGPEDFPALVQGAVFHIPLDKINLWPFYMPMLFPPSAGQGVNQAFEDVYTYALVSSQSQSQDLKSARKVWQHGRQERVDRILALNSQIDARRMPKSHDSGPPELDQEPFDVEWLYGADFEDMVRNWLSRVVKG